MIIKSCTPLIIEKSNVDASPEKYTLTYFKSGINWTQISETLHEKTQVCLWHLVGDREESDKSCTENENMCFVSGTFPLSPPPPHPLHKSCGLRDNCKKYSRTRQTIDHWSPNFLWQRATPNIVAWFAGHTWQDTTKWYN